MNSIGSGTLPRRRSVGPDSRWWTCPRCGSDYLSPSGMEPDVCPACRVDPDWKAEKWAQLRARRMIREAQRKAKGNGDS